MELIGGWNLKESYRIIAPVVLISWIVVGLIIRKILFVWFERLSAKTTSNLDDLLVKAAKKPVFLLIVLSGIAFVHHFLLPQPIVAQLTPLVPLTLKILTIGAIILFVDGIGQGALHAFTPTVGVLRASSGWIGGIVRILVFALGAMIILDSVGISITPIIASLGIGSLAVALALQPTLENLFAGFQILMDKPIQNGHFIRLQSGEEGFVDRIGWRSTWVRQLPNNMVIIPNSELVKSRVINFNYPNQEQAILVQMGVHYGSDLPLVEKTVCDVGAEVMRTVEGGVPEFQPFIRYHTFSSSSIDFTVILRGKQVTDQYLVKHEFIKAVKKRFDQEKIVIPFPIVALNTQQESAVLAPSTRN